jgi:hypothetical protein
MPVITRPHPATVIGLQILAMIECPCGSQTTLGLLNAQPATCHVCGTVHTLDAVSWDSASPAPRVDVTSLTPQPPTGILLS